MSAIAERLPVVVCDIPAVGPMLVIAHNPHMEPPSSDGLELLKRRAAKSLGISPKHFLRLPPDHESSRTTREPLLGLRLDQFDHLTNVQALQKTRDVIVQIGNRAFAVRSSRVRRGKTEPRPTNRTSLFRSEKARIPRRSA